ncbi:MAG TPA: DUF222 domain-containing protein [Terrimesophilobacter sp.]|nr:DUF222 domain-containing protein [Terrimesophilobacter sp.]
METRENVELVDPGPDALDRAITRLLAEEAAKNTPAARVERIVGLRAQMATLAAREQRELAELWRLARAELPSDATAAETDHAWRSLVAELAVASHVSDRTMQARLNEANTLVTRFEATLHALERDAISLGHARVIVEHGTRIADAETRTRYETAVIDRAITLTPGRLGRIARLTSERLSATSLQERHTIAREQRHVRMRELDDGMSELTHLLPTVLAEGIWDRLTAQAKTISHTGDPRSFDQLRADLAAELLLTGQPSGCLDAPHSAANGIRADVSIVIPALTLLGHDSEPATIVGRGPVDLDTATALAAAAPTLTRIITHPVSHMVLAVDQYRPSEQLRRYLRYRDKRCRFPSCNRQAHRCDIDHTIDAQHGGPTHAGNLACLCRNHHTLKHHTPWRVRQKTPGELEWTSPLGRVTTDTPDSPVCFRQTHSTTRQTNRIGRILEAAAG